MAQNEITLPIEKEPRLKIEKEVGGAKLATYKHSPHMSLLCPDPSAILIPAMSFEFFNPSSLDAANQLEIGDLINVTCNPKDDIIYQTWNPPAEWQIEDNFMRMFRITDRVLDANNFPVFLAKVAL